MSCPDDSYRTQSHPTCEITIYGWSISPGGQNGQDAETDPAREDRRRIRHRRKLRLKAALLGRLRGGQTSKVHLAVDRKCRPPAFSLTAGQAADSPQLIPVHNKVRGRRPVGRPRTRPDAVAGDKAYSSRGNRAYLRKRHIKADIPEKKDQAANRKRRAAEAAGTSATTPTSKRSGTLSSA